MSPLALVRFEIYDGHGDWVFSIDDFSSAWSHRRVFPDAREDDGLREVSLTVIALKNGVRHEVELPLDEVIRELERIKLASSPRR